MDPLALWRLWFETSMTMAEASAVMSMRLMGMSGMWSVTPYEQTRMWSEKPGAFVTSAGRATEAMLRGKDPVEVAAAAMRPIRAKTRANSRRLAKRGLKR